MALKDHITDSAKLREEEIEAIVADFLKYDPSNEAVVLLPKAQSLSVEQKILLYLVALRGWHFVVKENTPAADALPKEIEKATGVRGGTLRPTLRALVQSRMLDSRKGRYEIPAHNLGRVREAISSGVSTLTSRHSSTPARKGNKNKEANISKSTSKKSSVSKPSLQEAFDELVSKKWFSGGKTTAQLKEKLEESAVIVPTSRLPIYLLNAVRSKPKKLDRERKEVGGKKIWVYSPVDEHV